MTVLDRALNRAYQQLAEAIRHRDPQAADTGATYVRTEAEIPSTAAESVPVEASVSHGTWPALCEELLARTDQGFFRIAEQLRLAAVQRHLKRIGFVSPGRSEGRSTMLLTLALALARMGQKQIALVDADFDKPRLDRLLELPVTCGWFDSACSGNSRQGLFVPLGDGAVSLVPLESRVSAADLNEGVLHVGRFFEELARQFEMVLIDAGPAIPSAGRAPEWIDGCLDAVVTVSSRRKRGYAQVLDEDMQHWRQLGVEPLGVIETFA